ncbi:MAG: hypothetical protein ACJA1Z_003969, partial [Patiriisocius sp.]
MRLYGNLVRFNRDNCSKKGFELDDGRGTNFKFENK